MENFLYNNYYTHANISNVQTTLERNIRSTNKAHECDACNKHINGELSACRRLAQITSCVSTTF